MTDSNLIALIGCGNMGGSLLQGWLKGMDGARYLAVNPTPLAEKFKHKNVLHLLKADAQLKNAETVVLAVKPQIMADVLNELKAFIDPGALVISVAAGFSLAKLEQAFAVTQPIIRSMPNLPASIGKGMTVAFANKNVTPTQRKTADNLLRCVGLVEWLDDEKLIDAATAIVGNGPAYVFYLIEILNESLQKAGLPEDLAKKLVHQSIIGGASIAESYPEITPATLRKNVTSPGGTTEAALKILMNGEMQRLFDDAIKAATARSKELGK